MKLLAPLKHQVNRRFGTLCKLAIHLNFRRHIAQAVAQLFERIFVHVLAAQAIFTGERRGDKSLFRNLAAQAVERLSYGEIYRMVLMRAAMAKTDTPEAAKIPEKM